LNNALAQEMERFRIAGNAPDGALRGLYIDECEVDDLLNALRPGSGEPGGAAAVSDRVVILADRFGLLPFDVQALLICVAPDLDLRYERVYAYLQDDVGRKRPTVDLALRLLCPAMYQRLDARARFSSEAPLRRRGLLTLRGTGDDLVMSQLACTLQADERVVGYLLGSDAPDPRVNSFATILPQIGAEEATARAGAEEAAEAIQGAESTQADGLSRLSCLASTITDGLTAYGSRAAVIMTGDAGSGRRLLAEQACRRLGLGLLAVDTSRLVAASALPSSAASAESIRILCREAVLQGAGIYLADAQLLWSEGDSVATVRATVLDELRDWQVLVLFGGDAGWEGPSALGNIGLLRVDLPTPGPGERLALWRTAVRETGASLVSLEQSLADLAASFHFTPGQIRNAVSHARGLAAARGVAADGLTAADVYAGSRAVSGRDLVKLCRELTPRARWRDIVLPDDSISQLRELCSTVRHRDRVIDDWGFASRLSTGTGTTALFAGPSGTGKTMAAEVIAGELGLSLFRIDLSGVVSKWIGETEKNLDRVFRAAENSNAILFFDEADALFGKRSEVRDAHDRYANVEISYLLQKMETYAGIAILATNMRQQLDEAFLRRLSFNVLFPLPDEDERYRIWQAVWPPELPCAADVDLAALSRHKLAGGNIRNIVLAAAYLAADEGAVTMTHLRHAVRREYQKLGKQITGEEP
jgi:hypothetical protein